MLWKTSFLSVNPAGWHSGVLWDWRGHYGGKHGWDIIECYVELHKGNKYDVEAARENAPGEQRMPGEVNVT